MNSECEYCNRYSGCERKKKYIEYVQLHSQEIVKPPWFMSAYKGALFQLAIVMIKYILCDHGQILSVC